MKKVLQIAKAVAVWGVVAVAVSMMIFTFVSVSTFDRADRNLFGYKAFIVLSDSMSATDFDAGDIVFVKEVDPSTLKVGDIIAFRSQDPDNYGETVTHKIRKFTTDHNGDPAFTTYGTTTDTDDKYPVGHAYILGKYQFRLPKIGSFFNFLKTTPGYIVCIFLPFLILVLVQGFNCIQLFRRYKMEQMQEIEAEKKEIEEERRRSAEMLKELQELKAQLAQKDTPLTVAPVVAEPAESEAVGAEPVATETEAVGAEPVATETEDV